MQKCSYTLCCLAQITGAERWLLMVQWNKSHTCSAFSPLPVFLQALFRVSPGDSWGFTSPLIRFDFPSLTCRPSPLSEGRGRGLDLSVLHNSYLEHHTCSQTRDASGPHEFLVLQIKCKWLGKTFTRHHFPVFKCFLCAFHSNSFPTHLSKTSNVFNPSPRNV